MYGTPGLFWRVRFVRKTVKASFSSYGSRITSSAGCWDVVTTGYGDLYKTLALTIPIPRLLPEPLPRTRLLRVW